MGVWGGDAAAAVAQRHMNFGDIPSGLAAISQVPAGGRGQILAYGGFCELSQDESAGTKAAAGDFGFNVLASSVPAEKTKNLSADLANGRLAIVETIGIFLQDGLIGSACGACALYAISPLRAIENELGVQAPVGFGDPAGFTAEGNSTCERVQPSFSLRGKGRVAASRGLSTLVAGALGLWTSIRAWRRWLCPAACRA